MAHSSLYVFDGQLSSISLFCLPVDTSEPLPAKLPSQMALELEGDEGPAPPEPWEDADWADDEMTAGFGRAPPE
jgi:hypothetical protein